ncbi:unnamed protein product [Linum trigynum]|uniref:Uncharacterized protein n=1 Tax=Linum trigynum TaxID=586398 RepID=A0AAV2G3A0_9ROSI
MQPIANSGYEVKSNKKRRGKAKKSSRSVENLAKYGQGDMSPTMNNGVGGTPKNLKEFQPTHACDKYASLAKCVQGGKSMSMSSKYMPSIMNDGHGGMHKKVSYAQRTKDGRVLRVGANKVWRLKDKVKWATWVVANFSRLDIVSNNMRRVSMSQP